MKTHNVTQGSDSWAELRGKHQTASEAPVMMASHPNMKRDELLEAKATKTPKEFSSYVEDVIFADGHATEAAARPILEEKIGEELYPVTGTNEEYLASFDGMTMDDTIGFEHKQWNEDLARRVRAGDLPGYIYWQLEHQFLVCDTLQKIIFVVSDGTKENFVSMEYTPVEGRRAQLIKGWNQFKEDLTTFTVKEKKAKVEANKPADFPVLHVDVSGALTIQDNLDAFVEQSKNAIASINTALVSDQDFADAAEWVKNLKGAEERIDMIKEQALSKTANLKTLFDTLDDVQQNLMRKTRLDLNSKVESEKKNRKNQIIQHGNDQAKAVIEKANQEFANHGVIVTGVEYNMADVIKGLRSFDNMDSSVNDELARIKIEVSDIADKIRANIKILQEKAADYQFLFPKYQDLVYMDQDHLKLTIKNRIEEYLNEAQAKEQSRIARHKSTLAQLQAALDAGDPDESVTLAMLESGRRTIDAIDTTLMEEFTEDAASLKVRALGAIDQRIEAKKKVVAAQRPETAQEAAEGRLDADDGNLEDFNDVSVHTGEPPSQKAPEARGGQAQGSASKGEIRIIIEEEEGYKPVFIEIENANGQSISIGRREKQSDGLTAIVINTSDMIGV